MHVIFEIFTSMRYVFYGEISPALKAAVKVLPQPQNVVSHPILLFCTGTKLNVIVKLGPTC